MEIVGCNCWRPKASDAWSGRRTSEAPSRNSIELNACQPDTGVDITLLPHVCSQYQRSASSASQLRKGAWPRKPTSCHYMPVAFYAAWLPRSFALSVTSDRLAALLRCIYPAETTLAPW